MIHRIKQGLSGLLCICVLSTGLYASASDPKGQQEASHAIRYFDGSYAEVTGTEERMKSDNDAAGGQKVIGSKCYVYHGLDGEILFSYTVKVSFILDDGQAQPDACCTTFYVSEGWKKQRDTFGDSGGTAVFSNGKKKKTVRLTISCDQTGSIS